MIIDIKPKLNSHKDNDHPGKLPTRCYTQNYQVYSLLTKEPVGFMIDVLPHHEWREVKPLESN